jgi:type I restriction enzyme, S subunit
VIADLKPYAEYKALGLPWLGPVPGHWETRPAFGAFVPNYERNHGMKEKTVLSLSYGRIVIKPAEKLHGLVPESFETYQIVNPGDIVLRTTDLQNDHTSLRVGMVRDRGIITSAYLALRVNVGVSPDFGFQFLNVWDTSKAIYGYGSGLRQNLDFSHFKRMPVAVPPPDEQVAIVRFLDWSNGRLERAIRAKRKVIALLNEQKHAIIHRAITRGLDPSIPLKPSGIPWLGDVPQHWGLSRSKRLFAVRKELSRPNEVQLSSTQAYGVIPQSEFEEKVGRRVVKISMHLEKRRHVERDDFVISMRSFQGGLERAWASGAIRSSYVVLKPEPTVDIGFFAYLFKSHGYIRALQATADFIRDGQDLTYDNFRRVDLPLIPLDEQRAIAGFIAKATSGIDASITRLSSELGLLREYRTRLVADVVTGKLDVREAARRLPEEATPVADEDNADLSIDPEAAAEEAAV